MKILFLDIDGVMNSQQSCMYWHQKKKNTPDGEWNPLKGEFCPIAVSNLNFLLSEIPELQIVISSSWRLGRTLQDLKNIFEGEGIDPIKIINKTPHHGFGSIRGTEIQEFMVNNGLEFENIVILDDDSDMGALELRLVKTDNRIGFCWNDIWKIKDKLKGKNNG